MVVNGLLLAIIITVLYSVIKEIRRHSGMENNNFMTKESTGSIKGLAAVMIVFAHICQDEPMLP